LTEAPVVRAPRPDEGDAVAAIVYESAAEIYDRLLGDRERALALLRTAFAREGTDTSAAVLSVAELEGEIASVLASFPAHEAGSRGANFFKLLLARNAPWRWPGVIRYLQRTRRAAPAPPADALYIDALATAARHRRRGAARSLLTHAAHQARAAGLGRIALDTEDANTGARALYESEGYVLRATGPHIRGHPRFVLYVKEL
jgi:ribosomal protein S18 acetylase RimI-like enzyme